MPHCVSLFPCPHTSWWYLQVSRPGPSEPHWIHTSYLTMAIFTIGLLHGQFESSVIREDWIAAHTTSTWNSDVIVYDPIVIYNKWGHSKKKKPSSFYDPFSSFIWIKSLVYCEDRVQCWSVTAHRMGGYGSVSWCRCWTSHEASPPVSDPQSGVTLWTLQENDGEVGPFILIMISTWLNMS